MAQIIGLPKLSPTMEEGVLVKWVKQEGESVEPGDLVAEVETDKANMDFNLEDEGVLLKLLVAEGETVKLGAPVAILGEEGEDISDLLAEVEGGGSASSDSDEDDDEDEDDDDESEDDEAEKAAKKKDKKKKKKDKKKASKSDDKQANAASGAQARSGKAPVNPLRRVGADEKKQDQGGRVLASPLAKTLAVENAVDLRKVDGSGPGGRIVERDVRAAMERSEGTRKDESGSSTALAVREAGAAPAPIPPDVAYEDRPLSSMRKRIAQRLTEAKQSIPHFYLTRSFDIEPLLNFRQRLNTLLGDRGRVSVNDMIIKGVALALRRVPDCNASFVGDAIRYFTRVNVGVAVAIEDGLVTPVVRDADLKGIGVIGNEVRDLATRARSRRLKGDEITGSTFTVSNLGMFGIEHFEAIINPPEAGILAVGTTVEEPVVKDGRIVVGKRMRLTMSCDHRVIDGALGARFLQELVDLLEHPESLAL
ncbi:pyruvate dehydrogenase complex dihydrolipoamide acetyltransferase [Haliangium ochraceum]|uniref:Acetyltransferase component of pyruvate dehydrogenase complex n=1 Tax=Haliangium ochraceum (strain DSM 14365 / JCM 11303 / SMP-2) TaxID=502025 RepID=D0LY56_HALO1|nr:pyruvate dehydrogenase complex dihydrolipoamide acetyltransferase [Haliangium ochraceum]ACY16206.1 Dihydrolipoyllysine-residue acetyltransferase [Haliangium ochraceum DSM 14365]